MEIFQIKLSPEQIKDLDELQESTGASSRAEVLRKAIEIYNFLARETLGGSRVYSYERGQTPTELIIPEFTKLGEMGRVKRRKDINRQAPEYMI